MLKKKHSAIAYIYNFRSILKLLILFENQSFIFIFVCNTFHIVSGCISHNTSNISITMYHKHEQYCFYIENLKEGRKKSYDIDYHNNKNTRYNKINEDITSFLIAQGFRPPQSSKLRLVITHHYSSVTGGDLFATPTPHL